MKLTESNLTRIIKRVIKEQVTDTDNNEEEKKLNNELLNHFQKDITELRTSTFHNPDTIAMVMIDRANAFLKRSPFREDYDNTEKWGESKVK